MWQKARILKSIDRPVCIGMCCWTRPPQVGPCTDDHDCKIHTEFLPTNITYQSMRVGFDPVCVELLPEFAENVPIISWDEFLNQGGVS
jgi:hypothetical protein